MRVLRISHSGVVSAWRARDRELRSLGVDVKLATAKKWNEGGRFVRLSESLGVTPDAKNANHVADDHFVTGVRTFGRHPNLFLYDPKPIWKLLGERKWDVLDFHEEPFGLAMAELLFLRFLRRVSTPFVFFSAQNISKKYPFPFRQIEKRALKEASGAYVCNISAGEILKRKGMSADAVVLPLGVDLDDYFPKERPTPQGRLRIGYVGRLDSNKGVDVLLRSIAGDPQMTAEIYGAGPEESRLKELTAALGINERVFFRGFATQNKIPRIYDNFDVLVVPSLPTPKWTEQFCRVAVEAIASGVPVVASETGALPEVVGGAGILFTPGDHEDLHVALRQLLDDDGLWERLRKIGLGTASKFSWKNVAAGQLSLYEKARVI